MKLPETHPFWEEFSMVEQSFTDESQNIGENIGYARVSTPEQKLDMQLDALRANGCLRIFEDHGVSGAKAERKGLDEALKVLKSGDTLMVYKLDRLGRSVLHLADLLKRFEAENINFCSLTEGINTATPGGRLVFHVFSAVAEFQRSLIRENTIHGLNAARARGKRLGRPPSIDQNILAQAQHLINIHNLSISQTARTLNIPRSTLDRWV